MEKVILAETPLTRTAVDFDALVHVYARFVYKVAFALLRNSEDAEDVVQETFFRAFRSGEAGNVERMRAWLARIAWRLAVDRIRRRPRFLQAKEPETELRQVPSNSPSAEESVLHAESAASNIEEPVYQIGGPVSDPVPIQKPMPDVTAAARTRKVQGSILLSVVIGKDGAVRNVRVLRGLGFGLDESAVDTVTRKWSFKPSTLNGQPVSVQANIEVWFRM